jgi:arginyl-tRNA synthetase
MRESLSGCIMCPEKRDVVERESPLIAFQPRFGLGQTSTTQQKRTPFVTSLYTQFTAHIHTALNALEGQGVLPSGLSRKAVTVEPPRDATHGDLATNAAMVLAKPAGMNPRVLAEQLVAHLSALDDVQSAEIAGPGFINLRLTPDCWRRELHAIANDGADYGRSDVGAGTTVNVEYVSANPTGPMHMGHCRGAVVGDALAALLEYAGHDVIREYYVNDAGGQVDVLARSAHVRYREALGEDVGDIPEGLYPGDYLVPVGQALAKDHGDRYVGKDEAEWLTLFRETAVAAMLVMIKDDLALLGIHHDVFASEAEVQAAKKPEAAEASLRARDLVYDGVLEAPKGETPEDWEPVELPLFRSTQFGDDLDRPIKKSDGSWTYFGADMAYHYQKAEKADALINIWGADHAGTVKRIKAAVEALTDTGAGGKPFDVKLIQMVRLLRGGEPVKMSKRAGNFVTLADVVREVGKDVVRFTMLSRKADAQMDFDFAKVVEASKDNPVWYVQYASARIATLAKKVAEAGIDTSKPDVSKLDMTDLELVKLAAQFPRIIESAAATREPHRVAFYLYDVAQAFHAYYNLGNDKPERRILMVNDAETTSARLFLTAAIGQIIANGLTIMGVTAAKEM